MKYLYPLAILLFLLPLLTKAQSNYKPGYVITTKGDTLRGLIDYQDWEGSPKLFRFKANQSAEVQRFTATTANYAEINQLGAYQKYKVEISTDITNIQHLESFRDTSFIIGTEFLQVLQKGKNISLYAFTDNLKTRYYIKETTSDQAPYELVYKTYQRDYKTFYDNTFVKQLFDLATKFNKDDASAATVIESAQYRKEDILKAVSAINNISAAEYKLKYKDKARVLFFAGAGAGISTFKLKTIQANGQPSNTSVGPMITGGLDIIGNPSTSRLFFRFEVALNTNKFKVNFPNATSPYYPLSYSFNLLAINIIPQIVYNIYNTDNLKFYVSPGYQLSFTKRTNGLYYQIEGGTTHIPINSLFNFNTVLDAPSFKLGAKINKHYDISASYQLQTALTQGDIAQLNVKSIFIGFNYYFGEN